MSTGALDEELAAEPTQPDTRAPSRSRRGLSDIEGLLLMGGIVFVVLGFWLPAMAWGYLTDEHLTAWITQDSLSDAIARAQEHQGNSPLYFSFVWLLRQVLGESELVLRLPSVLAVLAAAYYLGVLGKELDHRDTGLIAAFIMVANGGVFRRAITARVYGLLLLFVTLSTLYLVRYLRSGRRRDGLVWIGFGVAALYMSPFAAVVLVVQVVPILQARRDGLPPVRDLAKLIAIAALACLPLVPQVLDLLLRAESLAFSEQPSMASVAGYVVPSVIVLAVLAGFVAAGFDGPDFHRSRSFRFAVAWAAVPILLLLAMGIVGSPLVGVDRYRIGTLPAVGLVAGMVIRRLGRPIGYRIAIVALIVLSLLSLGDVVDKRQGWREATLWAMEETAGEDSIMAFDYSLVEQSNLDQVADPAFTAYFTAPTLVYGVEQPVRPLPIGEGPATEAYLDSLFDELTTYDTIALVTKYASLPPDYGTVFRDRLVGLGYTEIAGPDAGLVAAVVFRR